LGNSSLQPILLNALPDEEFFARQAEVQQLFHAGLDVARGLQLSCFLSGARKSGKTEILKRAYQRLFWEQDAVIPFFTSLPKSVPSAEAFCREYFLTSALQCIGFLRKDARLVASEKHDLNRIVQLAYESKLSWLTDAVDHFQQFTKNKDLQALARLAILFPASIAARTGLHAFVFVDDFHHLASLAPTEMPLLAADFLQAIQSRQAPHCLAGASKPLLQSLFRTAELPGAVEVIPLRALRPVDALEMLEGLCHRFDVALGREISPFIVEQLNCNPFYLRSLVLTARRQSKDLESARQFASLYNFELIEGGLQLYFSSLLQSAPFSAMERVKALEFLHYCAHAPIEFAALHYLKGRELSEGIDFEAILNALASLGLIDYSFGVVSALQDNVLKDWVVWNFNHKVRGAELARVQSDLASALLRKSGQTRNARSQQELLKTLQSVLEAMNCQSVPVEWFHSAQQIRAEGASAFQRAGAANAEEMLLPEVISVSVPRNLVLAGGEVPGELMLARGFERGIYSDDTEMAWLAGLVAGSAGLDEVQRFYRQCEAIKRQEGFKRAQFWLIAEQKFNQAAISFAESQGLFTSSFDQLRMLAQGILAPEDAVPEPDEREAPVRFEMTIPMAADSELVAVRAFEQIAESIDMTAKAKGQVRMALMEACINARGALPSDAGKIHLSFSVASDRLLVRLRPEGIGGGEIDLAQTWGMKVLKTLMDEVKLHRTALGFELVLVKQTVAAANAKGEAV
jgi:anti-sigma regulatory factor (Ser/Thr protein kinase)